MVYACSAMAGPVNGAGALPNLIPLSPWELAADQL
ncbi:hypothetical protein ABIB45_001101 [Arthrobacter sp. UYCo732]